MKRMRYQQLLASGYDTPGAACFCGIAPRSASSHPLASQLDAANQLAEMRDLEEKVKEAEDKVKRAAVQSGDLIFKLVRGFSCSCSCDGRADGSELAGRISL